MAFTKIPNKIFRLGLGPYEIAAFVALASHGGKNAKGVFPSARKLMKETGMSRERLYKSLFNLKSKNIISWEQGFTGRANNYKLIPEGQWIQKKAETSVRHTNRVCSPGEQGMFATRTGVCSPGEHQPDPYEPDPCNQIHVTRKRDDLNFVSSGEFAMEMVQKIKSKIV